MIIKVNDNGTIKTAIIPTKTSDITNDSGYLDSALFVVTITEENGTYTAEKTPKKT